MKTRNKIVSVLVVTTTVLSFAGCAQPQSRLAAARRGSTTLHPVTDETIARAPQARAPKILPHTHFSAGRLFEAQGDVPKAIIQYRKAIAVNHRYVEAYHRLGILLSGINRRREATDYFRRAVQLSPNNATLRNNLGFELMLSRRWAPAVDQFEQAIAIKPGFTRAYINLGLALSKMNRFDDALVVFRTVLPDKDAYYNLGLMYRGQNRYTEARGAFKHVLVLDPEFSAAHTQIEQLTRHLEAERDGQDERRFADAAPELGDLQLQQRPSIPVEVRTGEPGPAIVNAQPQTPDPPVVANRSIDPEDTWDDSFELLERAFNAGRMASADTENAARRMDAPSLADIGAAISQVEAAHKGHVTKSAAQPIVHKPAPQTSFSPLPPRAPTRAASNETHASQPPEPSQTTVTTPADAEVMTVQRKTKRRFVEAEVAPSQIDRALDLMRTRESLVGPPCDDLRLIDADWAVTNVGLTVTDSPFFGGALVCPGAEIREVLTEADKQLFSYADEVIGVSPSDADRIPSTRRWADRLADRRTGSTKVATIDSWRLVHELEEQIDIVRNELDCLSIQNEVIASAAVAVEDHFGPTMPQRLSQSIDMPPALLTPRKVRLASRLTPAERRVRDKRFGLTESKRKTSPRSRRARRVSSRDWRGSFRSLEELVSIAKNELTCSPPKAAQQALSDAPTANFDWLYRSLQPPAAKPKPPVEVRRKAKRVKPRRGASIMPRTSDLPHEIHGTFGHQREQRPD